MRSLIEGKQSLQTRHFTNEAYTGFISLVQVQGLSLFFRRTSSQKCFLCSHYFHIARAHIDPLQNVGHKRNERLTAVSAPLNAAFFSCRYEEVDRSRPFTMQTRRFSDDGSVFSFDDHDFGCPLKLKDSASALVLPLFSLSGSLSWSSFDDGHIFSKYDMHDGEGSNAEFQEICAEVPAKATKDAICQSRLSPAPRASHEKSEPQQAARASLRRSRRRGAGGSFTCNATKGRSPACNATKGRSPARNPDENECIDACINHFEESISASFFKVSFDGLPSKSGDGLNWSSHSDSSRQRKGSSTTNFDYLPEAQRASLHKSSSLRHMHRDGSQRSLFSAASSKADACAGGSKPRGCRATSSSETTKDRQRARSRSLGAVPAGTFRHSPAGGRGTLPRRSSPRSKDELGSSLHSVGLNLVTSVTKKSQRRSDGAREVRSDGAREMPGLTAVWSDLTVSSPRSPNAAGLRKVDSKGPREVPELASMLEDLNIPHLPTAAGNCKGSKVRVSPGSDHQSSRRGSSRRSSHRMTSTRRPASAVQVT
jgi:hypothetical protein